MKCPTCGTDITHLVARAQSTGGQARAKKLTPAQRRASAQKAAQARWANHRPQPRP